jgi:hypothetical protein
MWHPVCCCNIIIFLDILWHISINKVHYLVTEKMQKNIKLSYVDDKTKHGHKAKPSQCLRKHHVAVWTEPPTPILQNIKVTKGPAARVVC